MELFTLEEIKADMLEFEGCEVTITLKSPLVFMKKYSRHYHAPLAGSATVNQLRERFLEFMNEHGRPVCDFPPEQLKDFGIYVMYDPAQPVQLFCQLTNERHEHFEPTNLPETATAWFIINTDYEVLEYFHRNHV